MDVEATMNFPRNIRPSFADVFSNIALNSGSMSYQPGAAPHMTGAAHRTGAAHSTRAAHHYQQQRHYGEPVRDIPGAGLSALPPPVQRIIQQSTDRAPMMPVSLTRNTNKIPKDSVQWRSQHEEADSHKQRGSQALKDKDLQTAMFFYDSGLKLACDLEENGEQVSILCSNTSYIFMCMKKYEEALHMAGMCVLNRPLWHKGHMRVIHALSALEKWDDVYSVGLVMMNEMLPLQELPKLLSLVLKAAVQVTDGYDIFHDDEQFFVSAEAWSAAIALLAGENSWDVLRIVILGNELTKPLCTSYTCQAVKLHGLLQTCSIPDWRDWGQRLAIKLLQNCAPYTTLAPDGKYPVHEAFKMCLKTDSYELLKHLFLRHVPQADRQSTDADNNTLLHLACQSDCPSKATAVKLLLEFGFDSKVRNSHGQTPVNLLTSGDSCHSLFSGTSGVLSGRGTSQPQVPCTVNRQGGQMPAIRGAHLKETADYLSWSKQQVKRWMGTTGLDFARDRLAGLDGELLAELKMMQVSAPKFFLEMLHKKQGMSTSELLQLATALRDL